MAAKFKKKLAQLLVLNAKLAKEQQNDSLDTSINYGENVQAKKVASPREEPHESRIEEEEPEIVEAPKPVQQVAKPVTPKPVQQVVKPVIPKPVQQVIKPVQQTPKPVQQVAQKPVQQVVKPVAQKPVQQVAQKPVQQVAPKPVQQVAPKPVQQVAPKPAQQMPKPAQQMPKPAQQMPKPVQQMPKPVHQIAKSVVQQPIIQQPVQQTPKPSKKVSFVVEQETSVQAFGFEQDESPNASASGSENSFNFGQFNGNTSGQVLPTPILPVENNIEMNIADEQDSIDNGFNPNFNVGDSGVASSDQGFNFGGNDSEISPFAANNSVAKGSPEKMSFLNHDDDNMDFNQEMNDSSNLFSGFMGIGMDSQNQSIGGINDLFSTSKADAGLENTAGGDAGGSMFDFFGIGNESPTSGDQPGGTDNFSFNFGGGNDDGSPNESGNMFFK